MVASDIGAEQSEIDECIDDDDETVSKLMRQRGLERYFLSTENLRIRNNPRNPSNNSRSRARRRRGLTNHAQARHAL